MIPMKHILAAALAVAISGACGTRSATAAEAIVPPGQKWTFTGPFGKFDRAQLQRGFRVYREVCQNCHGLTLVSFRNLAEPGGPEFSRAQATAIAKEYKIKDGPNDAGEMFEREGRLADRFPQPWANENAARQQYNGAVPPDLSLMAKARPGGEDYIYALLTGFEEPPAEVKVPDGMYYNKYFPGHLIGMPPILQDDSVTYADNTPATQAQLAHDVSAFLTWAAEPHLEARKQTGVKVILFLLVFTGMMYAVKRKVWADAHH